MRRIRFTLATLIFILASFTGVIFAKRVDLSMVQRVGTVRLLIHQQIRLTQALPPVQYSIQTIRLLEDIDTGEVLAYILDLKPKGFIAISTDTDIRPVVAYSYHSNFSLKDVKGNILLHMLKQDMRNRVQAIPLTAEIVKRTNIQLWENYLSEEKSKALVFEIASADQWPEFDNRGWLGNIAWQQGGAYNNSCPKDPTSFWGFRCLVGCTAVAMGQVIYYWQYPDSISFDSSDKYISKIDPEDGKGERVIRIDEDHEALDFPSFDELNARLASIGYSGGMSEIADFLFVCGIAVKMDYSDKRSEAWVWTPWANIDAERALKNKFGYQANGKSGSDNDFYHLLENDMKEGQPVLLAIYKENYEGGHAIATDGFRSTGEFHLNFGWGAGSPDPISEAWYFLPTGMPAGYTIVNCGVLNIRPNTSPNIPPTPTGPDSGTPGIPYEFTTTTTDPEGDDVAFKFDWGDGTESDWTSFVPSGSSGSASHSWSGQDTYELKVKAKDIYDAESGWSGPHEIVIGQPPNTPLAPTGPDSGLPGTSYSFSASTTDPDGDQVAFKFDWGDGTESDWTSFVASGSSTSKSHFWSIEGTYDVKVKAKDIYNAESGWSATHPITIGAVILEVDPSSLDFSEVGKGSSKIMSFRAYNTGAGILSGTINVNRNWMTVNPTSFEGNDNTISVTVSTEGLTESRTPYTGTITVTSNGGTKTIEVSVIVIPTGVVTYPNPFSPARHTNLTFWGTGVSYAKIRIFTLAGESVKTLDERYGTSEVSWNGRNEKGDEVARGIYIYITKDSTGKIAVIK